MCFVLKTIGSFIYFTKQLWVKTLAIWVPFFQTFRKVHYISFIAACVEQWRKWRRGWRTLWRRRWGEFIQQLDLTLTRAFSFQKVVSTLWKYLASILLMRLNKSIFYVRNKLKAYKIVLWKLGKHGKESPLYKSLLIIHSNPLQYILGMCPFDYLEKNSTYRRNIAVCRRHCSCDRLHPLFVIIS